MFEFPIKQRKLTTYGRKTSKPDTYSIARDDASPEKPKQTISPTWKNGSSSTSQARLQATTAMGKLTRPSPKKTNDITWDGSTSDDERVRPLRFTLESPAMAKASDMGVPKHSRTRSVPQHDISVKEVHNVAGNDKKRKREIVTRATSEAPRDVVKEADVPEVPIEVEKLVRRGKSVEPSHLVKPRVPVPVKKKDVLDIFDFPTEDEQPVRQKKPRSAPSKKKGIEILDATMEDEDHMDMTKSRTVRPREASQPPRLRARTPALSKKKEMDNFDVPMEDEKLVVTKRSRVIKPKESSQPSRQRAPTPALSDKKKSDRPVVPLEVERPSAVRTPGPACSKTKTVDIFDFPSEDEERVVAMRAKAVSMREKSVAPKRRARTPAPDVNPLIATRTRGWTRSPEPSRNTRRTKSKATTLEPSRQTKTLQRLKSPKATPNSPQALPGVGWHPSLAIHSSPNRRFQQGSSAPAALFNMIREQPQSPPTDSSENVTRPVTPGLDFDDMDVDATLSMSRYFGSPSTFRAAPSSQTPRQKQLWGQLLGPDLGNSPSDLPISKLNLKSTRKAPSMARASSDISQTTFSRRSRLIDSLKASAPIMEEEDDADDDETMMESSPEPSNAVKPASVVQPEVAIRTASTKVTYAQQRTFLEEQNEEAMYDILAEEFSQQTSGFGSQNQNDIVEESDPEDSQEAHPRGVHDLRAAGSKRRLLDELDHLVDDVQGLAVATISARRSALMEVAGKLLEPSTATMFLDSGMDLRLIKSMEDMADTVSIFLAATTIALLADSGATLNTLDKLHKSKMFARIVGLLAIEQDISKVVKERRSNMSKSAQASVVDFKETILKSRLFTSASLTQVSPQLMALRCLESVIRKIRDQGSRVALIDPDVLGKLIRLARSSVALGTAEIAVLEPVISILESHTLSRSTGWSLELVKMFVQVLPPIFGSSDPALQHSKFLALRLSLNLTNENPAASDVFALSSLTRMLMQSIDQQYAVLRVKVASEDHAVNVDNTVLALGVMINLAEFSDRVRVSILDGGDELLTTAVQLFLESKELAEQADSVEDGQTNVAFGYLAFMLGNLCQNEKVRRRVRRQLPGGNLGLLLEEMQEFIKIHQRADKVRLEGAEGEELERGHTQRLQALVDALTVLDY